MPIAFHASIVRATNEGWGTRVVFSVDETYEGERYLMLQRKHSYSEQDERFGTDDVYIETCGQGWSWYGHIKSFQFFPDRIFVQLDAEAAARMRDTGAIEATFDLPAEKCAELRAAIRQVFTGRAYYSEPAV